MKTPIQCRHLSKTDMHVQLLYVLIIIITKGACIVYKIVQDLFTMTESWTYLYQMLQFLMKHSSCIIRQIMLHEKRKPEVNFS